MMEREKLIAKIKALKSKTTAKGCTEEEAVAAAEKAAALMAEHSIADVALEISDQTVNVSIGLKASRSRIWQYISYVTNCALLHRGGGGRHQLVFIGREPGPQIACYLRDVCDRAIARAIADFKKGKFYKARRSVATKRAAAEDFTVAMIHRLGNRIIDLFSSTISDEQRALAVKALDALFPETQTIFQKAHKERFMTASNEGHRAGNKVHLARGINEADRPIALIGSEA